MVFQILLGYDITKRVIFAYANLYKIILSKEITIGTVSPISANVSAKFWLCLLR